MAGQYSTDTINQEFSTFHNDFHVPFTAEITVVPSNSRGRRSTYRKDLEKIARFIQEDLTENGINVATPVGMVPQFGDYRAKITVHGFVTDVVASEFRSQNAAPTEQIQRIHSGDVLGESTALRAGDPGGGNLSLEGAGQTLKAEFRAEAEAFVAMINAMLDLPSTYVGRLDKLTYNGVHFGRHGRPV